MGEYLLPEGCYIFESSNTPSDPAASIARHIDAHDHVVLLRQCGTLRLHEERGHLTERGVTPHVRQVHLRDRHERDDPHVDERRQHFDH